MTDYLKMISEVTEGILFFGVKGIQNLHMFGSLTTLGGSFTANLCENWISTVGVDKLATVGGSISFTDVTGNDFKAFVGFGEVTEVGGDITVKGHNQLKSMKAFSKLRRVGGTILIERLGITEIEGFAKLVYSGGGIKLKYLQKMTGSGYFDSLETIAGGGIEFSYISTDAKREVRESTQVESTRPWFPSLTSCTGPIKFNWGTWINLSGGFALLTTFDDVISFRSSSPKTYIYYKKGTTIFGSLVEVKEIDLQSGSSDPVALQCVDGSNGITRDWQDVFPVLKKTQGNIDLYFKNHPDQIEGSFAGFKSLEVVGGKFTMSVDGTYSGITSLTPGLSKLQTVGGTFTLSGLVKLTAFKLESLVSVQSFAISKMDKLVMCRTAVDHLVKYVSTKSHASSSISPGYISDTC